MDGHLGATPPGSLAFLLVLGLGPEGEDWVCAPL